MGTHSEILTDQDGRPVAFIDGIPDQCDHDQDGGWTHFNNDGEYFSDLLSPDPTLNDGKDYYEFMTLHQITGGCASCSKCGKPYTPDFFSMP
jgi:hypothetical protein